MEHTNKSQKNALVSAFRKVALVGVAALGLSGCVTMDPFVSGPYSAGSQYGSPVYGQTGYGGYSQSAPRGFQVSYQPPRAPWANDPTFRREVSISMQQANANLRMQHANYQTRIANCNANFARSMESNNRQAQNARRNGGGWAQTANTGARINVTNATLNQCRVSAETGFQNSQISQQQTFDRNVENLNRKYARQYGVRW